MRQQWHERRGELHEQFKKADTDGDGALNLAETQVAFPKLAENFAKIDTDNDARITAQEIRAASALRPRWC